MRTRKANKNGNLHQVPVFVEFWFRWPGLISRQLTNKILYDARTTRKESLELRHECRHTMCISRILRYVAQKERTSLAQSPCGHHLLVQTIRRRARQN